ncbi:MAG: ABC transporter permease [Planctomycetaceae bacterium]|nr:MAG: ABC transporter permease [Planctomycetaceae bacterium]
MIRPYVAVVIDSFRSAFASRVLWVALAVIYVFLLAISPIGYREVYTTTFRWTDFANGTRLKGMLAQAIQETVAADPTETRRETPAGRIARQLPAELQNNLRKVAEGQEVRIRLDILAEGLNSLYQLDNWYDADVWAGTTKLREWRELEQQPPDSLSEDLKNRRDRLRIEAALPGVFESRGSRSIALTYAGFTFPAFFQIEKSQFQMVLNHLVLRLIIDWVLGFVMIFLGILVTASIIPDMLQPGSLHLLLSKPVTRPLLFLAKFIGGCAFVLVCVTQLIVGLWLIAGFRLDIWNHRLLLCIPVCVFLFSVFYSVSAVSALKWRSPILAIGLANLFGAFCLIIGVGASLSDGFVTERDRVTGLTTAGPNLIASTRGGHLRRFDPTTNRWIDLFPDDTGRSDRILPPVTLADGRVVTARVRGGRLNLFGSGATPMLLIENDGASLPEPTLELPAGTRELIATRQGDLLAVNSGELLITSGRELRPEGEPASESDEAATDGDTATAKPSLADAYGAWLPKLVKLMGGPSDGFRSVLPRGMSLGTPNSVDVHPDGDHLFVYSGAKLIRLDRDSPSESAQDAWTPTARAESDLTGRAAWLRCLGDAVVLLRTEAPPLLFNDQLEPLDIPGDVLRQLTDLPISSVVACPRADSPANEGTVVIQTTDGHAWVLNRSVDHPVALRRMRGVSEVEAMHWDPAAERLWIAHHVDRATAWDLGSEKLPTRITPRAAETLRPALRGWRLADRYLVTPLRTITPQTGELGETIAAIVSGQNSLQIPFATAGDLGAVQRYNVWRPLLTCGAFVAVMLTLGSVYFARTDF